MKLHILLHDGSANRRGKSITGEDFIVNIQAIDGVDDLPTHLLESIYKRIPEHELMLLSDPIDRVSDVSRLIGPMDPTPVAQRQRRFTAWFSDLEVTYAWYEKYYYAGPEPSPSSTIFSSYQILLRWVRQTQQIMLIWCSPDVPADEHLRLDSPFLSSASPHWILKVNLSKCRNSPCHSS